MKLPVSAFVIPTTLACLFCLVCFSGCGPRLASTQSIDISPNDIRTILIDAISREQTVTIEASAATAFSVHAHIAGDESAVDLAVMRGEDSPKILAKSIEQPSAKLEFVVPPEKEGAVRFSTNGKEDVTVEFTISN